MSLESPQTYAEWYYYHRIQAVIAEQEQREKELSTLSASIIADLGIRNYLPDVFNKLFDELVKPTGQFLGEVGGRFVSEVADGAVTSAASPFFESMAYAAYMAAPTKKLTPAVAALLYSRRKITEELLLERFRMGGFEPIEAQFMYDSMRPYPAIPDIITWGRYQGDPDNIRGTVWERFDVSVDDFDLWEFLSWMKLNTEQVLTLFKRGLYTDYEANMELARIGWQSFDRPNVMELGYTLPNAMLIVQGNLMQGKENETIVKDISKADIHPDFAQIYLDGILTKPPTTDIIAYQLRKDPTLSNLDSELRKIGIHPFYNTLYKELAYQIPPVADIITMAVREAFTPSIAARFGQYEGLPSEFVEWVGKKGLSKEWAERYWAAHWSLPSPQQGFEMLHRNIIDKDTLMLLLRALDIMPFWRDKLIEMAFRPLSRVDVRRMFRVGVLDEDGVLLAYRNLGYSDTNAKLMTEFTIKSTRESLAKFTPANVITAYAKFYISEGEARSLLRDIGIKETEINHIIATANYKREWSYKEDRIGAISNLYKKEQIAESEARSQLSALALPSNQIDTLLQQWQLKVSEEEAATWTTAQTLSFLKKGLITTDRAIKEFIALGYDTEHIDIYIKSAITTAA